MYDMVEEALEYKDALNHYANLQNIQGPNLEQWNLIERVCRFLLADDNCCSLWCRISDALSCSTVLAMAAGRWVSNGFSRHNGNFLP